MKKNISRITKYIQENIKQIFGVSLVLNVLLVIVLSSSMFASKGVAIASIKGVADNSEQVPLAIATPQLQSSSTSFVIEVVGQVKNPGVYRLNKPIMVLEAIDLAGGITNLADLDYIHKNIALSKQVSSNEKIYIPSILSSTSLIANSGNSSTASSLINLNSASITELDSLPGIGTVLSQRIIDNRPYSSIDDLQNVEGISLSLYNKLVTLITI